MKIYEFIFCHCTFESSALTISIHKTKLGAFKAMNKFINDEFLHEYNQRIIYGKYKSIFGNAWKVGVNQYWGVVEKELLD